MNPGNLNSLSLDKARKGLRAGEFSAAELMQSCMDQILKYDKNIHAFVSLNEDALKQARKADINLPLGGIPIAVKDNFLTSGLPATASSNVLKGYMPVYESTVTDKLKKAGAIIIGKTNMDAWAHGSSTETSDFGPTFNPWNTGYLPGGSSGGSAAAVAADMCIAAIGSETAGSIRQPASWCGVTGFKPTYGRISRYGLIAMASSTDSPGPITKSVLDAAIITEIISGKDPYDATTSPLPVPDLIPDDQPDNKFRIGLPQEYLEVLQPEIKKQLTDAILKLKELGHIVENISLLPPKYAIGVYTIVQRAEVSSNLSRYDGIRYGNDRSAFGAEAKRRIMLGTYVLSSGYYDQYYIKAQKIRTLIINDFNKNFGHFDLLIDPPTPGTALKVGATKKEPMFGEMQDILLEPSSIAGLTGISIPCGTDNGLPVGFGLVGPQFNELKVLQAAHQYQLATGWHYAKPTL
jgi:aspartyl-tRNA(Asn)/glutamyl-tRNA(Gln) amidotransferase subunit A